MARNFPVRDEMNQRKYSVSIPVPRSRPGVLRVDALTASLLHVWWGFRIRPHNGSRERTAHLRPQAVLLWMQRHVAEEAGEHQAGPVYVPAQDSPQVARVLPRAPAGL